MLLDVGYEPREILDLLIRPMATSAETVDLILFSSSTTWPTSATHGAGPIHTIGPPCPRLCVHEELELLGSISLSQR